MKTHSYIPLLLGVLAMGCGSGKMAPTQPLAELPIHVWAKKQKAPEREDQLRLSEVSRLREGFEGKLLGAAATDSTSNWVFSPGSANLAMHLVANGAAGSSQKEFLEALGFGDLKIEDANLSARDLLRKLHAANGRPVAVANSVWIKDGNQIKPGYQATVEDFYGAAVNPFTTADQGKQAINAWVSENTGGSIPTLIDDLGEEVEAVLVNTISFRAKWLHPFEPTKTKDAKFTTAGGQEISVPTMHQSLKHAMYFEKPGYQALRLPYEGDGFSILLLLPKSGDPKDLLENWDQVLKDQMDWNDYEVEVALPRFTAESTHDLEPALRSLGFGFAFDGADFSGLASGLRAVSRVQQKCRIEVNEEGTKADSAVNADMVKSKPLEPLRASFIADRPFAYVVTGYGSILFAGVCNDPRG